MASKSIELLPEKILKEIISFLECSDILYSIMNTSQRFHNICFEQGELLSRTFLAEIKVPYYFIGHDLCQLSPKDRIKIISKVIGSDSERLPIFSYFTDGGVDKGDPSYFIGNIFCDNPAKLYSSIKGSNINVKSICSSTINSKFTLGDLSTYAIKEDIVLYNNKKDPKIKGDETYRLPIEQLISSYDPQNLRSFAILKYLDVSKSKSGYTCFLQSFALFISMEEIDANCPIVQLFDSINSYDSFQKFGFNVNIIQEEQGTKIAEFDLTNIKHIENTLQKVKGHSAKLRGVFPIIWGELGKKAHNYLNISQKVGFRYLLLKLIDSNKTSGDANIDCYNLRPSGVYIKLKDSFEE